MKDDVLYLEVDEEITAAIDKLLHLAGKSVKIVVPKRSTLLQSVVNLKLLKKAADDAGKSLVLVTGDRTATHLASRLGLAVAATLTSKPEILEAANQPDPVASDEIEAEDEPLTSDESVDGAVELASTVGAATAVGQPDPPPSTSSSNKPSYAKPMLVRKPIDGNDGAKVNQPNAKSVQGTSKVPDFNRLQKRLLWGGLAVLAIILLLIANYFFARSTVTLFVQGSKITTSFPATLDPTIKTSDPVKAVLAANDLSSAHDLTATANASGKQDVGTKAGGTVTISNCYSPSGFTIPAGTKLTGSGKDFITNDAVVVSGAQGNFITGCTRPGTGIVPVTAVASGDTYNLAGGTTYAVSGYPNDPANGVVGKGSQMTGGTSKTVNIITQSDIDKAVADLLTRDKDSSQKDLENKVPGGSRGIAESFVQTAGAVTANPVVGTQSDQTVVVVKVSYSELAVTNKDLKELLNVQELQQIGTNNQIYDDGIGGIDIVPIKINPGAASNFTISTTAYGGAKLNPTVIAKQLAGKRYGDAADLAAKLPGVARADIKLSPFWATSLPHIASHIQIVIKVANGG